MDERQLLISPQPLTGAAAYCPSQSPWDGHWEASTSVALDRIAPSRAPGTRVANPWLSSAATDKRQVFEELSFLIRGQVAD